MNKIFVITAAALLLGGFNSRAQTYQIYKFTFSGTAYQTNAAGVIEASHITDQTLLQDRARQGNITNLNTISLVYHINGNQLGDTVEVISNATGQVLTTEFGFYFGSAGSFGRTAVTNLLQTQERRVDYIYSFDNSAYTYSNGDSIGAAFTSKSYVKEGKITNAVISGTMSWGVIPTGTDSAPKVCIGTFSLGRPIL